MPSGGPDAAAGGGSSWAAWGAFPGVLPTALLHADPANSVRDICRTLGISKATLYRYLADQRGR